MNPYPLTRHDLPPFPDLSEAQERERLSAGALQAFFNMMTAWKVKDEDARKLLGGVSHGTYYAYKKDSARVLDQDKLLRISFLTGIFKALNILHGSELADR